jgi:hypothetical protein
MRDHLDLERYPIDKPGSAEYAALVRSCQRDMRDSGMFNLHGFVRPAAYRRAAEEVLPLSQERSYTHGRRHNVYFKKDIPGLAPDHAALTLFDTVHHTLCDDQLRGTVIHDIYEYEPLPAFIAAVLEKPRLYLMGDPLARVNVIDYRPGETLNWHFDRSVFTVTLLVQAPEDGGEFQYRSNLRSDSDPNYEGVGRLLTEGDPAIHVNPLSAGTLNVFAGKNTLHRVTTVRGKRNRVVAVYSYYEQPNVMFSDSERLGFYGRSA